MFDILAVIPCLNEEKYLDGLVENLVANSRDLPIHIVIADGGSADKTPEIAKALADKYDNVSYLHNPKKIQSAAVNLAVEEFGQEATYLIRIDAHAKYPNNYFQTLIEEQRETGGGSIVVSMDTVGITPFQEAVAAAQNSKLGNGGSSHRLDETQGKWVDHGHHALMLIKDFLAAGGYDDNFSHNEDYELDYRMAKLGGKIWLTGKINLIYYPRSDAKSLFKQYYNFGRGVTKMMLKHKNRPRIRQVIPAAIAPAALLSLLSPILPIAALPINIWILFCLAYGALLGFKAKKLSIAASGIAAMIMHMAWSIGFWKALFDGRATLTK